MRRKKLKTKTITDHKFFELNKDFENNVKLKKLKKSNKNKDYYTY